MLSLKTIITASVGASTTSLPPAGRKGSIGRFMMVTSSKRWTTTSPTTKPAISARMQRMSRTRSSSR
jgi:hypothetical protein